MRGLLSNFSSNVILTKIKAMYGKRIHFDDYGNLLNCKSVPEVASYLKNNTSYASVLNFVDEINIHRHELEFLLKNKLLNELALLGKYELTTGEIFAEFIIIKTEIDAIIYVLMRLLSAKSANYPQRLPGFFKLHTRFDIENLSKAKDYDDFFKILEKSPYYKLLQPLRQASPDNKLNLSAVEQKLYNYLYDKLFEAIEKIRNKWIRNDLKSMFITYINYSNFVRIIRMKRSNSFNDFSLLRHGNIRQKYIDEMFKASSESDVFDVMYSINQGKKLSKMHYNHLDQIPMKSLYNNCRHKIYLSANVSVVFICYMLLSNIELSNIVNVIEGIRYSLPKEEIEKLLILKG